MSKPIEKRPDNKVLKNFVFRAKQLAIARLRVQIHELTDAMEEAVRNEEFLKEFNLNLASLRKKKLHEI
jgi:hypothetical protein